MSGCWIEFVQTAASPDIDTAPAILSYAVGLIARQTVTAGIDAEIRMLSVGVISVRDAALTGRHPEPAGMIEIESMNETRRHPIGLGERGKAAARISQELTCIKSNPQIAGTVF